MISPLLFNVALHGMEKAAGIRYYSTGRDAGAAVTDSPVLVRFADDFVVMCSSREEACQVKTRLVEWLTPKGLAFNEDKTRIVHAEAGFDFLGFNIRRYHRKLLIKPSPAAIRRIRERLRTEMRSLRGANAGALLRTMNPIVRGWSAYYRTVVSSEVFTALDNYVWKLVHKWAKHTHPNKPKHWVVDRYFGRFNKTRQDRWVFGDRASGAYLLKFSWTKIVRHQLVKARRPPTTQPFPPIGPDGDATDGPPVDKATLYLLQTQDGRCPLCRGLLLHADDQPQTPREWEQWLKTTRRAIAKHYIAYRDDGTLDEPRLRLTHSHCQRRHDAADRTEPALRPPASHQGLLEPRCGESRKSGSEGAPARQRTGATRLILGLGCASAMVTLRERTTQYGIIVNLPRDHTAHSVNTAVANAFAGLPPHMKRTLTWDQGVEMGKHQELTTTSGIPIYFAERCSPWQRGANENYNGLARQYFPIGTDLSRHSTAHVAHVTAELDDRPRKGLGYDTPAVRFAAESARQPVLG